eukprot:Awhi_evm1s12611
MIVPLVLLITQIQAFKKRTRVQIYALAPRATFDYQHTFIHLYLDKSCDKSKSCLKHPGPKNLSTSPSDPSFKSTTTNEEAEGGVLKSTKTDSTLDLPEDEIVPLIVEEHTYVKKR